ncbi:FtsX-like permease family protein [Streptomyces albidoflavus]
MNSLALGLRLVVRGPRATQLRFLLMTLGCALGVACLAAALSIPAILAAHDGRAAGRDVQGGPSSGALFLERKDPFGSRPLTRIFISPPKTGSVPLPPGVERVPQPGEVVVSPALRDLLAERPGLKGALPGRVVDTIGPAGLTGPQELYAYVGRTRAQLPADEARPLGGYGNRWTAPDEAAIDDGTVAPLRFTLCCLVLLPLFVYLSVCVRLSAEARSRRLASLRLLGLSARDTMRVSAVETLCAAAVGAVLGVGLHLLVNAFVAQTGWVGLAWYPADGLPSAWTLAACLLGCPALAYLAGRRHAREAALRPLAVRRQAQPGKPRRWLAALLVLPGLGIVTAYCVLGVLGVHVEPSALTSFLVPAGALLTGAGLVLALPPVTAWLAARVAATTQRLPLTLAMRHHEAAPGAALRVVSGLVLLVYAASLTQGVLVELDQVSRRTAPNQEYAVPFRQVTAEQRAAMTKVEGVSGHATLTYPTPDQSGILVATCGQLEKFVRPGSMRGCVDGRPLALHDPGTAPYDLRERGRTHAIALRDEDGRAAGSARFTVPEEIVTFSVAQPSALTSTVLLVPPKALPPGLHPAGAQLLLSGAPEPEAVQATLDRLAGIAPTAQIDPVGIVIESLRQLSIVKGLLGTGMILGLVIGVAAFLVSATDRAMDRRRRTATLTLLGIRTRTLRAAQCAQVLLPLAVGIGGALVAGRLAESSYLVTGGGAVFWDGEGLPLLLLSGLGVLGVAGLASLPMARRHLDPELLRRD